MLSAERRLYYLVAHGEYDAPKALPCDAYGVDCEMDCETPNDCIYCELCQREHGFTDDGSCGSCGEVGIREV